MTDRGRPLLAGLLSLSITLLLVPNVVRAQLAASEAEPFVGSWLLTVQFQQGDPVQMTLEISDEEGQVVARVSSSREPEPRVIEKVSLDGESLLLSWQRDMGGRQVSMAMRLDESDSTLSGTLGVDNGTFNADVTGVPSGSAVTGSGSGSSSESTRRSRRSMAKEAELELDGQSIKISYDPLPAAGDDFDRVAAIAEDDVLTWNGGRTLKLLTDADLQVGESRIEAGNASPDYPGVYGLWLQRTGDGWGLVFNRHADVWGSMHDADADVAAVPVESSADGEPTETLEVTLTGEGREGVLEIAWGAHRWRLPFRLAGT